MHISALAPFGNHLSCQNKQKWVNVAGLRENLISLSLAEVWGLGWVFKFTPDFIYAAANQNTRRFNKINIKYFADILWNPNCEQSFKNKYLSQEGHLEIYRKIFLCNLNYLFLPAEASKNFLQILQPKMSYFLFSPKEPASWDEINIWMGQETFAWSKYILLARNGFSIKTGKKENHVIVELQSSRGLVQESFNSISHL